MCHGINDPLTASFEEQLDHRHWRFGLLHRQLKKSLFRRHGHLPAETGLKEHFHGEKR